MLGSIFTMMSKRRVFGLLSFISITAAFGCVARIDNAIDAETDRLTCNSFTESGTIDAKLDARVKVFLEAAQELRTVSSDVRGSVRTACANIATDLGAQDTWSALGEADGSVFNDQGTGACNAASTKIRAIVNANARANFALSITRGYCRQDYEEQKVCDRKCAVQETCEPGAVETRCEPAQLSVVCEGKCKASAHCEGSAQVEANCMGKCESTCVGECKGTCTTPDGKRTENDPNCRGKCSSSCNGKCRGLCKVEASAGIECGVKVRCKGGCEGRFIEPVCETKCSPPTCTYDTHCWDSCTTKLQAKTVCEPTRVELYADASVSAEVQALVKTVNANVGTLVDVAEVKGPLVVDAAERLKVTGNAIVEARGSLSLESQACAVAGARESVLAASRLGVSAKGGIEVTEACKGSGTVL